MLTHPQNSNIVQFFSMLKRDDVTQQLVYYQAGIGTYTIPEIATPWTAGFQKTLDMMIGIHLNAHIMGGYEFLMQNCAYPSSRPAAPTSCQGDADCVQTPRATRSSSSASRAARTPRARSRA